MDKETKTHRQHIGFGSKGKGKGRGDEKGGGYQIELCKNGNECLYFKQGRCKFHHIKSKLDPEFKIDKNILSDEIDNLKQEVAELKKIINSCELPSIVKHKQPNKKKEAWVDDVQDCTDNDKDDQESDCDCCTD